MKTIALEELVAGTILDFCENLAELGYRPIVDKHDCEVSPDMWFRYKSPEEQVKVASKLLEIIERDAKRFAEDKPKKERKK